MTVFTVKLSELEVCPLETFCTDTVKAPASFSVAGPTMVLEVLAVSTLLSIVQGLQLGPFTSTCAVPGSKLPPLMVKVNC
jgi:hypothetical protein